MTAEKKMFILTDVNANNNKFWEITIDAAGTVSSRNGRVGSTGQARVLGSGVTLFQAKIREKTRKGYQEIKVLGAPGAANVSGAELASAAEDQIGRGDPIVTALMRDLVAINRHQIIAASGGQMDVDLTTGVISTPVGVVTKDNILRARTLLQGFEPFILGKDLDNRAYVEALEDYLMLVPQKVGSKRGWHHDFITGIDSLTKQGALLDQLEGSIEIAEQRLRDKTSGPREIGTIFDVKMRISEEASLRRRIEAFYQAGRKAMHASQHLKISRIFEMSLGTMARDFEVDGLKVGGIRELWHGTRAHNLLSILKSGLIIPRDGGSIHVTGRMFGNGVYFSDQSTKSLNYAHGYWDGGRRDDRCYMFLADVAMGRPWHPTKTGSNVIAPAGYDSVYARGGQDMVSNNEMIVYRTSQVNLKYLVEFEA